MGRQVIDPRGILTSIFMLNEHNDKLISNDIIISMD